MAVDLQCTFFAEDGKQQQFPIPGDAQSIPAAARVIIRTRTGIQTTLARAVPEADEGADKYWTKAGAAGDALVVQILLKKQESGLWLAKKLVVTTSPCGAQGEISLPPEMVAAAAKAASAAKADGAQRVTCADETLGDEMLECARYEELEDLESILKAGMVPVDYQNAGLNTALHYAAANGFVSIAATLLDRGAKNLPNSSGNTPLHWALQNKHIELAKLVLTRASGVNVLAQNAFGKSCVTEAFALEDQALAEMVLAHPSAASLDDGQGGAGTGAAKVEEEEVDEQVDEHESQEVMDCT